MAFTWQSAGHAFSSLFKDVVTVSKKVVPVLKAIEKEAPLVEELTMLVSPQANAIEQIAFGALGELIAVCDAAESSSATGVSVAFDPTVVAEVKKLLADFPEIVAQVKAVFPKKV